MRFQKKGRRNKEKGRGLSSGMLRRVVWQKLTDVSEMRTAFIIRAMMVEVVSTSETSFSFYQTTRRNIPEDSHLYHTSLRENLKSQQHK
jgi:hypothetical protein